jgi:hypothetical protein
MTGTTKSGFAYEVSDSVFENMELIDALADAGGENPLAISTVCKLVFGSEQRNRLYNHLRLEDGTVPLHEVSEAIAEVFAAKGSNGKN